MKIIGLSAGETPVRSFGLSLFDESPVSGISMEGGRSNSQRIFPGKYSSVAM